MFWFHIVIEVIFQVINAVYGAVDRPQLVKDVIGIHSSGLPGV